MSNPLKIPITADETPLKKLNAEIRKTKEEVAKASIEFGKQSQQFENSSNKLKKLQTEQANLNKTVKEAGNTAKRSAAQMLEFGENLTAVGYGISAVASSVGAFVSKAMDMGSSLTVLQSSFKGTSEDLELFKTATARTVSEANILKLSNQATDLGISLDKQAYLFSLAEDAGDKYGGSVEDNIQRVVLAIAKNGRGLEQLGITTVKYKKVFDELIKSKNLDNDTMTEEDRIATGFESIMKITGMTLQDVTGKTQDVRDKMESLKVTQEDATASFGQGINKSFDYLFNIGVDILNMFKDMTGKTISMNEAAKMLGESVTLSLVSPFLILKKIWEDLSNTAIFNLLKSGVGSIGFGGGFNPHSEFPKGINAERVGLLGEQAQSANERNQLAKNFQYSEDTLNNVTHLFSLLNLSTDSFVGKIIGGFNTVLTIMEAIKTVNSIFSFIPGFAGGGYAPAGSPFIVGERGTELMFNSRPSYIMNHNDSMKYLSNNSQPTVNVYLAGNIDVTASLQKENRKYNYVTVKQ